MITEEEGLTKTMMVEVDSITGVEMMELDLVEETKEEDLEIQNHEVGDLTRRMIQNHGKVEMMMPVEEEVIEMKEEIGKRERILVVGNRIEITVTEVGRIKMKVVVEGGKQEMEELVEVGVMEVVTTKTSKTESSYN